MRKHLLNNAHKEKHDIPKNDEFYTRYVDISKELGNYTQCLSNKVIYCNCDSEKSNFVKYFIDNKDKIRYKEFIHSSSDFRSNENIENLKRCDVVITNPPFSLFREFIQILVDNQKDFLIVSPLLAFGYKAVVDLFKSGRIKTGYNQLTDFDNTPKKSRCGWLTTFPIPKTKPVFTQQYDEKKHPKYDNYDAINVDRLIDIPGDYDGIMGVPITFFWSFDAANSDYDIIRTLNNTEINGKLKFKRLIIQKKKL